MIVLVLPAYNEEGNLGRLLKRVEDTQHVLPVPIRVLLVDDGSTDGTAQVAQTFRGQIEVEVLRHGDNRGLAAAIKTGLSGALERATSDDDVIISMDADDTHSPALFPRMLACTREGYDLVIASRFTAGARVRGLTWPRKLFSVGASYIFRLLAPMEGVHDYTCGYRAYRAPFLRNVWDRYGEAITTESGFSCMADILLKCRDADAIAVEVPLILRYDRKEGASKMRVGRTITDTLRMLLRSLMQSGERRLRANRSGIDADSRTRRAD